MLPLRKSILAAAVVAAAAAGGASSAQAATSAAVADRTLTITGDAASNTVALRVNASSPTVLRVDFGNDGTTDKSFAKSTFERVAVDLGAGDDRLVAGTGIERRLDYEGGAGSDKLDVSGGSAAELFTIVANGGRVSLVRTGTTASFEGATGVESITVRGNGGNDTVLATSGLAKLTKLTLLGGDGDDVISGGDGADAIQGNAGNDRISGGRGDDAVSMGDGDDRSSWDPGDGNDELDGQTGSDTLDFAGDNVNEQIALAAAGGRAKLTRDVDALSMDLGGIETIDAQTLGGSDTMAIGDLRGSGVTRVIPQLGTTDDADVLDITGTPAADAVTIARTSATPDPVVTGLAAVIAPVHFTPGTDALHVRGAGGDDKLLADETQGALAAVTLFGDDGADTLSGGSGGDDLRGGAGNDTLLGKGGADHLDGQDGNDTLTGGDGDDAEFGGPADDSFAWAPGDDTDRLEGDIGTDGLRLDGGNGAETFSVTPNGSRARVDRISPAPFAQDLGSVENVAIAGNGGDDTITAANGLAPLIALTLDGGAGKDALTGGDGADRILGGADDDTVSPGRGNDVALLGDGNDRALWNPGDAGDTIEGQAGSDVLDFRGANVSETFAMTAKAGRVRLTRDAANVVMDLDDVERADVATLAGADIVDVGDLTGTDLTGVNADLGTTPGGAGDGLTDQVIVKGTNGDDVLSVGGSSGVALVSGGHTKVAALDADPFDHLRIDTLAGTDSVNSAGLAPGTIDLTVN